MNSPKHEPLVLVIIRSPLLGKIFELCLEREGIPCIISTDPVMPVVKLQAMRSTLPDIVFIDVGVTTSTMDGFGVIRYLKQHVSTTIIAITSDEKAVLPRLKARLAGASDCIEKPVAIMQILACVRKYTSF